MRLAILQLNPMVGQPRRNASRLEEVLKRHANEADLFVTPELFVVGYPARDLLSLPDVLDEEARALESLRELTGQLGVGLLVGHTERRKGPGKPLFNAASLFDRGQRVGRVHKRRLPAYDIFEEERFFEASTEKGAPLNFRGTKLGISICEDHWTSVLAFGRRDVRSYPVDEIGDSLARAADIIINLSASPFSRGKVSVREDLFASMALKYGKPLVYVNSVGGQDELLFDGGSFAVNAEGQRAARAPSFEEKTVIVKLEGSAWSSNEVPATRPNAWAELEGALVMGLGDFVRKSGGKKILLGLSGGIDSALCAALAAKALGPTNVLGVSLPGTHTSQLSRDEAKDVAQRLGISFREILLKEPLTAFDKAVGFKAPLAKQNLQSRTRGLILNTLANEEGAFTLCTGNKSELAMGYATLYGDLAGALAPLGDLYKTEVYGLSHFMNRTARAQGKNDLIPPVTLSRPPTAELAPDQKDADDLPPYEVLDGALEEVLENQGRVRGSLEDWDKLLAPRYSITKLRTRVHSQEFKRRQAPPLLRVHGRAFGQGWHMPITKGSL